MRSCFKIKNEESGDVAHETSPEFNPWCAQARLGREWALKLTIKQYKCRKSMDLYSFPNFYSNFTYLISLKMVPVINFYSMFPKLKHSQILFPFITYWIHMASKVKLLCIFNFTHKLRSVYLPCGSRSVCYNTKCLEHQSKYSTEDIESIDSSHELIKGRFLIGFYSSLFTKCR